MQKSLLITLAFLLVAGSTAFAVDPAVERVVRAMDKKAQEGKIAEVIAEALARVGKSDTATNRYLLGRAYGMNQEYEKAREQFERVLEMDMGSSPLAYHGLGAYYLAKGEVDEAERNLKKAIELDDTFTRAHVELGKLYLARQDRLSARRQFLKVLNFEPGNNDVRALLAYQYLKEQLWQKASDEFLVVLSKDPDHVGALKGIAITYAMEKKAEPAIAAFEKVIARDPKDMDSYVFLTNIYRGIGKTDKAIATLERLLLVIPAGGRIAQAVKTEIKNIESGRMPGNAQVTIPILIEQLKTGSVEVRREAMTRLASLGLPAPPREVVRAVKDKDPVIRAMAIRWVGEVGGEEVIALMEILARHPTDREKDEKVRATVAQALGKVGNAAGIPVLLAVISDDESLRVYRAAIPALRDLSGVVRAVDSTAPLTAEGREALVTRWNEWWMGKRGLARKLDAIDTIGRLGSRRMCRYLVPLLGDAEELVSARARVAFGRATEVELGTAADTKKAEGRAELMKRALTILRDLDKRPKKPVKPAK